jgi:hypothetical protein
LNGDQDGQIKMSDDLQLLEPQPAAAPLAAESAPTKSKRSKPHTPFSQADRLRIQNLIASGLTAAQIAERMHRGLPQVSRVVREISEAAKPTSVPVLINDSKTTCSAKLWTALSAAARRRNASPANLLIQIAEGVLKRGSVDSVLHTE